MILDEHEWKHFIQTGRVPLDLTSKTLMPEFDSVIICSHACVRIVMATPKFSMANGMNFPFIDHMCVQVIVETVSCVV
jgi:hypothetical protein